MESRSFASLMESYERLIARPNPVNERFYNGLFTRYENPVLTRLHVPPFWMYDANPDTNPYMMQRLPVNAAFNAGAMKLKALINTYFKLGGMQVQFNVVSTDSLHKAQEDPMNYKDLIVRIAGFSTYFVSLDKRTQDDFITRTEQML